MENQFNEFLTLLKTIDEYDVEYILIGGVAVIIHGFDRLTQDVDLFIRNTPGNIEKLRIALHSLYQDEDIEEITKDELENYPVIRFGTPKEFYIDIMARIGQAFTFDDLEFEIVEYQGVNIKVATPETLYKLKANTYREKDKLDLNFLRDIIESKQRNKKK